MCDYSLQAAKSRPAVVGEKLVTHNFNTGTRGFTPISQDADGPVAVCLLPGTEVAFDLPIKVAIPYWCSATPDERPEEIYPAVAVFAQKNKETPYTHLDCLQFADGRQVMLTQLEEGQTCSVLQLPAAPKTPEEVKEQTRAEFVG